MSTSAARRRRRMGNVALGLAMFVVLAAAMVAETANSRAATLGRLLPAQSSSVTEKQDASVLATTPDIRQVAVTAVALNPTAGRQPAGSSGIADALSLAAVLSALAMLNIGFVRHLRRVYASPRRGEWRRG